MVVDLSRAARAGAGLRRTNTSRRERDASPIPVVCASPDPIWSGGTCLGADKVSVRRARGGPPRPTGIWRALGLRSRRKSGEIVSCCLFSPSSPELPWSYPRIAAAYQSIYLSQRLRMAPRKPSTTAEIALVPLKNCLVNLPPSLTALLVNANTVCRRPDFLGGKLSVADHYL